MKAYLAYKLLSEKEWKTADVKSVHADRSFDAKMQSLSAHITIGNMTYTSDQFADLIIVCEDERKIQWNKSYIVSNTLYTKEQLKKQQEAMIWKYEIFNEEINKAITDPITLTLSGAITDDLPNAVGVRFKFNNAGKFYKSQLEVLQDKYKATTDLKDREYLISQITDEHRKEEYGKQLDAQNPLLE